MSRFMVGGCGDHPHGSRDTSVIGMTSLWEYMMKIDVLDKGYVRLVDVMGDDLSVVNAARVSYDKESEYTLRSGELQKRDRRLLEFLWREGHTSPFRHAAISFEVYAPLMVARQWYKHAVASTHLDDMSGWNESSRRYVTEDEQFYMPNGFRSAPENSKQGSGDIVSPETSAHFMNNLDAYYQAGNRLYQDAMKAGIAPEQARLFLPANGLYVRWRWTVSLHAVLHFLNLREEHTSQWEIQQYAKAVGEIVKEKFPTTYEVTNGV
jgi:thymidylate synthase (FAD)